MKTAKGVVVVLLVCALAGMGLLGCNTVRSAGSDIKKGGNDIQRAVGDAPHGSRSSAKRLFTITASAEPGGSISPSGATSVPRGGSQTYIATANAGYQVTDVLVDGRSVGALADLYHDDSSTYTFDNMARNHMISASFDVISADEDTAENTEAEMTAQSSGARHGGSAITSSRSSETALLE